MVSESGVNPTTAFERENMSGYEKIQEEENPKNPCDTRATPHKDNNKIPFRASNYEERVQKYPLLSLSKNGLSGFITRQAAKLMRDKMYE
ncbi:hypothetical protein AALA54_04660, partial [Oscillospiraceae bacterium 44-34]